MPTRTACAPDLESRAVGYLCGSKDASDAAAAANGGGEGQGRRGGAEAGACVPWQIPDPARALSRVGPGHARRRGCRLRESPGEVGGWGGRKRGLWACSRCLQGCAVHCGRPCSKPRTRSGRLDAKAHAGESLRAISTNRASGKAGSGGDGRLFEARRSLKWDAEGLAGPVLSFFT